MDEAGAELVAEYADCIQLGARNMQNYSLLKAVGRLRKPVLLKRGLAATINELLLSAEYILAEGNPQVILCERGVRSFDSAARNMFDLNAIPIVQRLSHLPIIADPSHGTGLRDKVTPMARAAVAAGADGIIVEVHPESRSRFVRWITKPVPRTIRATHGSVAAYRRRDRPEHLAEPGARGTGGRLRNTDRARQLRAAQ